MSREKLAEEIKIAIAQISGKAKYPDLLDAVDQLAIADEWQPIETAPKDGTHVLLGRFPTEHRGSMHVGLCAVDWWRQHKDAAGYIGWGRFNQTYWPPTHWMKIPPPPAVN